MTAGVPAEGVIGRERLLGRLDALLARVLDGRRITVLVAGEAGIGKTSLVRAAVAEATGRGVQAAAGTCIDTEGAPGYWPWTQALESLVRSVGVDFARRVAGDDAALLASIAPSLGGLPHGETAERGRLLLMDATSRFLEALAGQRPVVVVLDDLQWADESSLALLDFVARAPQPAGIGLIGAYRPDELSPASRRRLGELASRGDHLYVDGLDPVAVGRLAERVAGEPVDRAVAEAIHRRTGGHPFFVRELALLACVDGDSGEQVPSAVREAIERRLARLPEETKAVLEVGALLATGLRPDVVAATLGRPVVEVEAAARTAVDAGILTRTEGGSAFAHDLLRETIVERLDPHHAIDLHQAIGAALESRMARGGDVAPSDLARHFIAALALDGPDRAVRWALAAAAQDSAALAFGEAAGHLRRLRAAAADAAVDIDDVRLADVLLAEADALGRAGETIDARGLLHHAADVTDRLDDPGRTALVALAIAQLGARFAARRDGIVRDLERALAAVAGRDDAWEARLTAALARELQHSVPEDRPRAGPLSERALELGRRAGDPATLLACLLARHDLLWTPGAGEERVGIARELVAVALAGGDQERHAEALLLLANALLEQGSPAFEAALESCLAILDALGQPRHRYIAATRRACVALLRGQLDDADRLIEEAAALGERIREPDTGNVRMSHRLELVRARGGPDELRAFAAEAVEHWTGAPVHAHAVAAGFLARAGDLDAARHHVAAVVDLGSWRADRSYLWSVFVRELAHAAIALGDRHLAGELFDDLRPLAGTCGVNGAVVAFAGSHAHTAGLLASALGQPESSRLLLDQAAATYRRLGAGGWLADVRDGPATAAGATGPAATMSRRGPVWHLTFAGSEATVAHTKGMADIARLLAAPGAEVHVLDLVDAGDRSSSSGAVVDRRALGDYRRHLADLEAEADEAAAANDFERRARVEAERQALADELGRVAGTHGRPRQFANHPAERARKAVTARVRDAIRKQLQPALPELAAHLERTIVTGSYCRYRADSVTWDVDLGRGA